MGKSNFLSNILKLLSGTAIVQVITLASVPIITRLYSPADFGVAALFISALAVFSVFATLRYNQAIILPESSNVAQSLVKLCSLLVIGTGVAITLLIFIFHSYAIKTMSVDIPVYLLLLLGLTFVIIGLKETLLGYSTREKLFARIALTGVISSLVVIAAKIIFATVLGSSYLWIIFAAAIGHMISLLILSRVEKVNDWLVIFRQTDFPKLKELARDYRDFPMLNLPTGLVNKLGKNLPVFMLGYFFSPAIIGYYALANSVISTVIGFLNSSFKRVYMQRVAELSANNDFKTLIGIFNKSLIAISLVSIPPLVLVLVFGGDIFGFVFGPKWKDSGLYVQILAPWLVSWALVIPAQSVLIVIRKQAVLLKYQSLLLILRILAIGYGGLQENPILALVLFTSVNVLSQLTLIGIGYRCLHSFVISKSKPPTV